MPKRITPLSPSAVANAKPQATPYKLRDGRGLYLAVETNGSKLWRYDYRRPVTHKQNTLSLGAFADGVSLKRAREKVDEARKLLADGIDPGALRKGEAIAKAESDANSCEAIAREWLAVKAHDWVEAHTNKETLRLSVHAFPWIGAKPISEITVADIRPLLARVVNSGHIEQAHRLREQLSRVFRFAIATGRASIDPAHALSEMLPARPKRGFPAVVDPKEIGELLRAMEGFKGTFAVGCALRLAPLWFARPGELRQAEWAHFTLDGDSPEYRVPASKRKLKKAQKEAPDAEPHIVPLSIQALAILRELQPLTGHRQYLFPGARDPKRCMSDATVKDALH
tara:strand:+ start:1122 stop:2141 length:1020 start_codon:yes stop_codon:yes gene_type:complete